jgi:penicillin-binding protein 2
MIAVRKGLAANPIGKPRNAADVAWPPGAALAAAAPSVPAASAPAVATVAATRASASRGR